MSAGKKEWYYLDKKNGKTVGPITLGELDALHGTGEIDDYSIVANTKMVAINGPESNGIRYSMISRSNVEFSPSVDEFYESRSEKQITVLSGPNNCGKTFLLKQLFSKIGHEGYLVSCNRFSHVDMLNTRQIDELQYRQYYDNFMHQFFTSNQNSENNDLRLEQILVNLKDKKRNDLFELCESLIGNKFSLQRTDPENTFSPFYVDMDGENLRYGSSGTRLLLTLLGTILNERFTILLIDEPEIGLNPGVQSGLARFIYDSELRNKYCPHLKQIYIATHSHIFLDRRLFSNNFIVKKARNLISIRQVKSIGDLQQLQFNLLGNELESVFLPSAIIIVEGDSDVSFITKLLQAHIPERSIAVVRGGGDGEIQKRLNFLKEAFGHLGSSPYHDRVFVILDKQHSVKTERIVKQGVPEKNITVWSMNGIEYFYPPDILSSIFFCSTDELDEINLENDPIIFNGITKSKKELSQAISDIINTEHVLHDELSRFIQNVKTSCA